jgi:hypothetical protein
VRNSDVHSDTEAREHGPSGRVSAFTFHSLVGRCCLPILHRCPLRPRRAAEVKSDRCWIIEAAMRSVSRETARFRG